MIIVTLKTGRNFKGVEHQCDSIPRVRLGSQADENRLGSNDDMD